MCDTIATKIIPSFKNNGFDGIIETSKNQIKSFFKIQEEPKFDISEADNSGPKTAATAKAPLPDYTKEEERLKTFANWTNTQISPDRLAKAGFYFIDRGDVVRCAFCRVEGHCWLAEDNPMDDHKSWMPHCPFVQQQSDNCSQHDRSETSSQPLGQDTFGGFEIYPNSLPEDDTIEELHSLAKQWTRKAYNSEYRTEESRMNSFKRWPIGLKQKPELMAQAGLYYLGVGDEVVCHYCGGGLRNWEEDDSPWEQHAKWFPKCTYLLMMKGRDYVDSVQMKLKGERGGQREWGTSTVEKSEGSAASTARKSESSTSTNADTKETSTSTSKTREGWEKGLCKICYKDDVCLVFKPCDHALTCVECGLAVEKCPVCRRPITGVNRMFLS